MSIHKPFSIGNYEANDPVKWAVAYRLNLLGYYTKVIEDYGADIKSFHHLKGYQEHEVEHRTMWKGDKFPFSTIHIPERKTRLLKDTELFYWVVNEDCSGAMVCNAKNCMVKSCLKIVPNNSIPDGEEFYDIPISRFKYIKL